MKTARMLTIVAVGLVVAVQASGATWYVDANAPSDFNSIQAALDDPCTVDGDEIEVAPGTYNEAINFNGKGVRLYSSGGRDVTTIDGSGNDHVVKCVSLEDANTILEGFTITGGYANGAYPDNCGGGMYNFTSSPMVTNCIFWDNSADYRGGGMYNFTSSPTVTNCTFSENGNQAGIEGGGIYNYQSSPTVSNCGFISNLAFVGGGMYNYGPGSPTVTDCNFSGNITNTNGAGMLNKYANPTVTNCTFSGNWAGVNGGGIYNEQGSPMVANCRFSYNSAQWGAGMYNYDNSNPTLTNCTFGGNGATYSGGGILNNVNSSPTVTNCILWGNTPDEIHDYDSPASTATVSFSDVRGGWSGTGNKDGHPLFVNALAGDWHLGPNSPCVDAGNNAAVPPDVNTDLDGNCRFVDDANVSDTGAGTAPIVDMGAYERQTDSAPLVSNAGVLYWSIQEAIDQAGNGDVIEVSPGTLNEAVNFNGLAITLRSTDPNDANIVAATATVIDGDGTGHYHVVKCVSGEDSNTVLAGFTITGGVADGASWPDYHGGGMLNDHSSPTVTNCIFTWNWATEGGGGMLNHYANPTVTNCMFSYNAATNNGGGIYNFESSPNVSNCTFSNNPSKWGGGMCNYSNSSPTVSNCTFSDNSAQYGGGMTNDSNSSPTVTDCNFNENEAILNGGGMCNGYNSNPTVTNCTFSENSATVNGGGMYDYINCSPTISNCAFINNAGGWGGGLYNYDNSNPTVSNCTFSGNTANYYVGAGILNNLNSSPTVTNCILWGNTPDEIHDYDSPASTATVSFSDVQGDWSGEGNIDKHPLLQNVKQGDLSLAPWSPCIDAGNNEVVAPNATDIAGLNRLIDGDCNATVIVDMGAHEFQHAYVGDFDSSCRVDMTDFAVLALAWLASPLSDNWNAICDISTPPDEYIDYKDLKILAGNWVCDVNTPITCDANQLKNVFALDAAGSAYVLKEVCGITDAFTVEQMLYQAGYSPDEYLESTALPFVEKFAPVLYFDQAHKGLPMSAQVYFATMMSPSPDDPEAGKITWTTPWDGPCYPDCSNCGAMMIDGRDESNCGMQNNDFSTLTNGQVPTYYKVISDIDSTVDTGPKGRLRIMYWWFYGFQKYCNPLELTEPGEHHGDWEHIIVTTDPNRIRADSVTYSFHGVWYTRQWGGFEDIDGHPVVYVGKLSHGNWHSNETSCLWTDEPYHCCEYADCRTPDENTKWYNAYQNLVSLRGSEPWMLADRIGSTYEYYGHEYGIYSWRWGPHISYCDDWLFVCLDWTHVYACSTHPTNEPFNWTIASCDGDGCGTSVCEGLINRDYPEPIYYNEGWPWEE